MTKYAAANYWKQPLINRLDMFRDCSRLGILNAELLVEAFIL